MKLFRAVDISYRYSVELLFTVAISAGQATSVEFGKAFIEIASSYNSGLLAAYYLVDFAARTILHPYFFPDDSKYRFDRGRGLLMRAGRNALQMMANMAGLHLFMVTLAGASTGTLIGAGIGLGIVKILIDTMYDLLEAQFQADKSLSYTVI